MTLEDALFETSEHDEPTDDILTDDLSPPRRSLGPDPSLHPEDWAIEEEFSATYCRLVLAAPQAPAGEPRQPPRRRRRLTPGGRLGLARHPLAG